MSGGTYDACVVDKVVKAVLAEDGRDRLGDRPDAVEVGDLQPDDVQRALRAVLQPVQRSRLLRGPACRNDEVLRGFEQLPDEFQPNAARCSMET